MSIKVPTVLTHSYFETNECSKELIFFVIFKTDKIRLTWQKVCDLCLKTEKEEEEEEIENQYKNIGTAKVETRKFQANLTGMKFFFIAGILFRNTYYHYVRNYYY